MKVAVFHPGTQHSWQTAQALQELDALALYATSIFYQPDRFPYRLERMLPGSLGERLHREFSRFSHAGLDTSLVRTAGLAEWLERLAARCGLRRSARWIDTLGNARFAGALAKDIRSSSAFALWGYSGSSLGAFELGKQAGRTCILDRTIGDFRYYNAVMAEVRERYGAWFLPQEGPIGPAQIERDQREYALADVILAGSEYAAQTVREYGGKAIAQKVRVLNYCYDERLFGGQPEPRELRQDEPVKFLFVGQVSPRKGIHHVLEAFARIPANQASLTIVGPMHVPAATFAPYQDRVTYIPGVPRAEIPGIMAKHHVLVFPSYFEGSALSLLEALASGLAIIQTPMSGQGVTPQTGLVVPRPDTDALHDAMLSVLDNRLRLQTWRAAAQVEARNYAFAVYRQNIAGLLGDLPG